MAVYGVEKYGPAGLLVSSADRGWSGLSAELRSHLDGVIAWKSTQSDTEICVDIHGNGSVITRRGGGIFDRTVRPVRIAFERDASQGADPRTGERSYRTVQATRRSFTVVM